MCPFEVRQVTPYSLFAPQNSLKLKRPRPQLQSSRNFAPLATAMAWRSEAAHDHSRVLAQCFAGADHGPGVAGFTFAQLEDQIWQQASSWKAYCKKLARRAAGLGHECCLRVLHELGFDVAAAGFGGLTPAHLAAQAGHEGCLRVLHELGGEAAASLAAAAPNGFMPAPIAVKA